MGIPLARLQHGNENACRNERAALQYIGRAALTDEAVYVLFPLAVSGAFVGEDIWKNKDLR